MGKVLECIDAATREFIARQQLYFVATAPSGNGGHVNVSPKGHADTFTVIDDHTVAYLDLTQERHEYRWLARVRTGNGLIRQVRAHKNGRPPKGTGRSVLSGVFC